MADAVATATMAPILDIRRIVAGEQNEVYDVTLERAPSVIVKISHRGSLAHEREAWVLEECAARGVPAPRIHARSRVEVADDQHSIIVMEKLAGERLCDVDLSDTVLRRVLGQLGEWLRQLHAIPVRGFGYLDGSGAGYRAAFDDWLADSVATAMPAFERAAQSVGLELEKVQAWVREILDALQAAPQAVTLVHNDLLANHVLVHEGRLSGIIDWGEVAAEPPAMDFARWHFNEGARFPVEWIKSGYGDASLSEPPNDRTYRALWLSTGLWLMQWYHGTGFLQGVEAARDRLLSGEGTG